jgi:hypothetical protein
MQAKATEQKPTQTSMSARRRWRGAALAATLLAVGLGLAAYGGTSPKASANSPSSTISGCSESGCSSSSATRRTMADALKYAGCMRSHGLTDFPDPTVGSNGLPSFSLNDSPGSDLDPNSPPYQAAQKACKKDLPNLAPQTPAEKTAAIAAALKYAECMRAHGEPDFPDPNGQGVIQIKNATGILDPSSPQYLQAAKACQSLDKGFGEQSSSRGSSPNKAGNGS